MRLALLLAAAIVAAPTPSLASTPEEISAYAAADGPLLARDVGPSTSSPASKKLQVDPSTGIAIPMDPTAAAAPTPIPPENDLIAAIPLAMKLIEAIEQGQYAIAVGLALMILTFVAIRLPAATAWVPKKYAATAVLAVGLLSSLGVALASGVPPGRAAFASLVCSALAIAFWEGVVKHVWDFMAKPKIGPA